MSVTRTIPAMNWTRCVESAIKDSKDGDEIVVSSDDMREYVKLAIERQCPDKNIVLTVNALGNCLARFMSWLE